LKLASLPGAAMGTENPRPNPQVGPLVGYAWVQVVAAGFTSQIL